MRILMARVNMKGLLTIDTFFHSYIPALPEHSLAAVIHNTKESNEISDNEQQPCKRDPF